MTEIHPLDECIVLVTGGANGLGYSMVDHFVKNGAQKVIIVDVNEEKGENAVTDFGSDKTEFKFCDVTNENQVDELVKYVEEKHGGIQVLVNNAGILDENNIKRCIDINLTSVITMTYKFYECEKPPHTIINVSSIYGYRNIEGAVPIYAATKHGVAGFTKFLGHTNNYKNKKIRVVGLCPGMTRTHMTSHENSVHGIRKGFEFIIEDIALTADRVIWQQADDIGRKTVEIYKRADSGTLWLVEGGQLEQIPV